MYRLNSEIRKLMYSTRFIGVLRVFGDGMLYITLILYLLDTFSPIQVSWIWGVYFLLLGILDYPTGNLGDIYGFKRILQYGYFFQLIALPFLIFGNSMYMLFSFMALFAIGKSQESGSMESLLDNEYRIQAEQSDLERKIYSRFQAKSNIYYNLASITGFIVGGVVATYERKLVFVMYFILIAIIMLFIFILLPNSKPVTSKSLRHSMKQSFTVFISTPSIFFYFTGIAFLWAANESIWHPYLLFRIYREYTGSDTGAGLLRSGIFLSGFIWQILVLRIIDRVNNPQLYVFISSILSNSVFFYFVLLYYKYFPPTSVDFTLILGLLLVYQIPSFWESLQGVLMQRINLDLIPSEHRNSLYSLLPTLARIIGVPLVLLSGYLSDNYGFIAVFYWLIFVSALSSVFLWFGMRYSD